MLPTGLLRLVYCGGKETTQPTYDLMVGDLYDTAHGPGDAGVEDEGSLGGGGQGEGGGGVQGRALVILRGAQEDELLLGRLPL